MSALLRTMLSLVSLIAMALWVVMPFRFDVVTPRLGIPAIVQSSAQTGNVFDVTIKTSVASLFTGKTAAWQVWLQPWETTKDKPDRISLSVAHKTSSFQQDILHVNMPDKVPEGSYSLVISDGQTEQLRPRAVHVIGLVPPQISIVQFADLPELGEKAKGDQRLQEIIDEINIINPELVLMTGDIAYGGSWQQYQLLIKAMARINAPVIAAPGNHEYQGWAAFLTLLGSPYHSVRYGPYQIISLNSGHGRDQLTESQYAWLQQAIIKSAGRVPLVQLHHPLFRRPELHGTLGNHVPDLARTFQQLKVPIVLSGHWHGDAVYDEQGKERRDTWQFTGTPYVVTTAAGADLRKDYATSPMHHGYRLIRLQGDRLLNYTYDMDGDGQRDATSSIPLGKLTAVQQDTRTILVDNKLNEAFEHALVRFEVPGEVRELRPDTGTLVRVSRENGSTYYDVQLAIAPRSQQYVTLSTTVPTP